MKTFDGRPKGVLRAAVGDLAPRRIIDRGKEPYPVTAESRYEHVLRRELFELLGDRSRPAGRFIDPGRVAAAAAASDGSHRAGIEFVLALDRWLDVYRPRMLI